MLTRTPPTSARPASSSAVSMADARPRDCVTARLHVSAPGYQLLLGGHLGDASVEFGRKALRLPAKACAEATVRLVGRFANERQASETFPAWLDRIGGAAEASKSLADLAEFPAPFANPAFYVDYGETGPFTAEVGAGECAG